MLNIYLKSILIDSLEKLEKKEVCKNKNEHNKKLKTNQLYCLQFSQKCKVQ